jgi:urease accessory protein
MTTPLRTFAVLAGSLVLTSAANAHTGGGAVHGFAHGFEHPFGGWDHLLAMVAIGLWAAQLGGRAIWAVPTAFVATMLLGGLAGMAGFSLPFMEVGILASVVGLGVLIAAAFRLPLALTVALAACFALFHGQAHGLEMPANASGFTYAAGFVLSTIALHAVGLAAGFGLQKLSTPVLTRAAGACVAVLGVWLTLK